MSKNMTSNPNQPILRVLSTAYILEIFTLFDKKRGEYSQTLFLHMETRESSNKIQNSSREDASLGLHAYIYCMQYIFLIVFFLTAFESLFFCVFIYLIALLSEGLSLLWVKPETINKSRKDLDLGVFFWGGEGGLFFQFF